MGTPEDIKELQTKQPEDRTWIEYFRLAVYACKRLTLDGDRDCVSCCNYLVTAHKRCEDRDLSSKLDIAFFHCGNQTQCGHALRKMLEIERTINRQRNHQANQK